MRFIRINTKPKQSIYLNIFMNGCGNRYGPSISFLLTRYLYTDRLCTEPRRSSRATKGVHSAALRDASPDLAPPKKRSRSTAATSRKKSKKKKPTESGTNENDQDSNGEEWVDDGSITRCVCGLEEDDDKPLMAQCENCLVWQHTECTMGVTDEDRVPEKYFCEQCRPDLHKWYFDRKKGEDEEKAIQVSLSLSISLALSFC